MMRIGGPHRRLAFGVAGGIALEFLVAVMRTEPISAVTDFRAGNAITCKDFHPANGIADPIYARTFRGIGRNKLTCHIDNRLLYPILHLPADRRSNPYLLSLAIGVEYLFDMNQQEWKRIQTKCALACATTNCFRPVMQATLGQGLQIAKRVELDLARDC
jgi:hypothetical protein